MNKNKREAGVNKVNEFTKSFVNSYGFDIFLIEKFIDMNKLSLVVKSKIYIGRTPRAFH